MTEKVADPYFPVAREQPLEDLLSGIRLVRYLRESIYTATHHVYVGIVVFAIATFAIVWLTPRRFGTTGARPGENVQTGSG